jgi:hypothetical protein
MKREKGIHAPGEDDVALQTIYNKDLRTYAIQYVARAMHKVGNRYVDLPVTCVLIKIGQKYPYIEGVYRGVSFCAGFTQLQPSSNYSLMPKWLFGRSGRSITTRQIITVSTLLFLPTVLLVLSKEGM